MDAPGFKILITVLSLSGLAAVGSIAGVATGIIPTRHKQPSPSPTNLTSDLTRTTEPMVRAVFVDSVDRTIYKQISKVRIFNRVKDHPEFGMSFFSGEYTFVDIPLSWTKVSVVQGKKLPNSAKIFTRPKTMPDLIWTLPVSTLGEKKRID